MLDIKKAFDRELTLFEGTGPLKIPGGQAARDSLVLRQRDRDTEINALLELLNNNQSNNNNQKSTKILRKHVNFEV